ncbi:MAG: nuclear transport factor 2 family protein [Xanthobacteraceae bacterium]
MTKFAILAQLLISTMMGGSVFAAEPDLRLQLEARYAAMKAAMAARDSDAITALLTPDFVSTDSSNKSEDAAMMIQEVASSPRDPNKDSHTTLTKTTSAGDSAVAEQRYEMTTKKTGPDGTMQDIRLITLSTDTWVHLNGSWRLKVPSQIRWIMQSTDKR